MIYYLFTRGQLQSTGGYRTEGPPEVKTITQYYYYYYYNHINIGTYFRRLIA